MIGYVAPSAFAITLAALGAAASRESILIDNTTTIYDDFMMQLKISPSAIATLSLDRACYVWFYGSVDGTIFDDPCTGADAAVTIGTYHALKGPFVVPMAYAFGTGGGIEVSIGSVASFFGGNIPPKWGIVVENQTNAALNGTEGNFIKYVKGVFYTT